MCDIISLVSQTARFSTECYSQLQSLNYIRENFGEHYHTYEQSLINLDSAFKKLTEVFEEDNGRKTHTELFKHKILSASIINTISLEFIPTHDFIIELGKIFNNNKHMDCKENLYYFLKYSIQTPRRLKNKLETHIRKLTKILSQVVELNKHIFGTANRIEHPILRKAWMLVGENQINDSSISTNLFQENLFILLKYEIDFDIRSKENEIIFIDKSIKDAIKEDINKITQEEYKNKHKKIRKIEVEIKKLEEKLINLHFIWKESIELVINKIDNSSTTEKDGYLSISELNQTPEDLLKYITAEEFIKEYVNLIKNKNTDKKNKKIRKKKLKTYKKEMALEEVKQRKSIALKQKSLLGSFMNMLSNEKTVVPLKNENEEMLISQDSVSSIDSDYIDDENDDLIGLAGLTDVSEKINEIVIIKDEIEVQNSAQRCNIDFKERTRLPNGKGYGYDFPAGKVCDYIIPLKENEDNTKLKENNLNYEIESITFKCSAYDQRWGGTNHSQVRYQINDGNCIQAFLINYSSQNEENEYSFTIHNISNEDKISIWLLCPPWSGWEAHIEHIIPIIKYKSV